MQSRYGDWQKQAEEDLKWASDSLRTGHFAGACFTAQQAAEKSLKALAFFRGFDRVKSHSLVEIANALEINGRIREIAGRLDLYYISARYPDALPAGFPAEFFSASQAEEAIQMAQEVLGRVKEEIERAVEG